jgi:alpha-tubulin suppressor-like RCC1 family protein
MMRKNAYDKMSVSIKSNAEGEKKFLYSWGFGKYGQIGNKFVNYSIAPIKQTVDEKEDIFYISAGESHSAFLSLTPRLYVYGKNYFGQLGINNSHYIFCPTKIELSEKIKVSKVVCGGDHSLLLTEDNQLYSWGLNIFGQLGLGDFINKKNPCKVEINSPTLGNFSKNEVVIDITAGAQHSMILTSKNKLYTCGYAGNNSLGYETTDDENVFRQVESIVLKSQINKIAAGVYHSACIADNEILWVWGKGNILIYDKPSAMCMNELNSFSALSSPPQKKINVNSNSGLKDLKIGEDTIYILTKADDLYGMGDNQYGQLGNRKITPRKNLERIDTPKVKQLEVGYGYVMIITYDNKIYGWGNNEYGQLTLTDSTCVLSPTFLEELSGMSVFKLSCGGYHSLGIFDRDTEKEVPANEGNNNDQLLTKINKDISNIKKSYKMLALNSNIKRDFTNLLDKLNIVEMTKKKLMNLENILFNKENQLKDLKAEEEELTKTIENNENRENKNKLSTKYMKLTRGFDNNFEITEEEINFGDRIGVGTFGEVKKGYWRKQTVAVKFLKGEMLTSEESISCFIDECNILKNLRHPNILLFMGACTNPPNFFVVTEYCDNGNLFELLHSNKQIVLNWEDKRRIAIEIAQGMNYLHSFDPPILHRDLKSMNILLDKNFQVKIADFGSTKFLDVHMTKQKGTFQWMAPEVIKGNSYSEKADVFSFGIILHELASRQPPYYGIDRKEVAKNVSNKADYRPQISRSFPKEWVDLMVKSWDHNPTKRPSYSEIIDMLSKMKLSK